MFQKGQKVKLLRERSAACYHVEEGAIGEVLEAYDKEDTYYVKFPGVGRTIRCLSNELTIAPAEVKEDENN